MAPFQFSGVIREATTCLRVDGMLLFCSCEFLDGENANAETLRPDYRACAGLLCDAALVQAFHGPKEAFAPALVCEQPLPVFPPARNPTQLPEWRIKAATSIERRRTNKNNEF
jgi:hypothetical protein